MCPGYNCDPHCVNDLRKTAVIDRELSRLNIDVAALQETRLPEDGSLREHNYTFFWRGKGTEEARIHGVGFAVRNSLLPSAVPPSGGSERLLTMRITASTGPVTLICAYAPTLTSSADEKDCFYDTLDGTIRSVPSKEGLYILGDFNARVGADHHAWPISLGHHGVGKLNENGQRLLELCSFHKLAITNTFFENIVRHKVSWRHPRSKHWHQLDLILTRRKDLNTVRTTRSLHSAECDTDHILVRAKINLIPRKLHHSKPKACPRINARRTSDPRKTRELLGALRSSLAKNRDEATNAVSKWKQVRSALFQAGLEVLGRKERKNEDWFEANWQVMEPAVEAKRQARLAYNNNPCQTTRDALRIARSKCQQTARRCANDYWMKLSVRIQSAAESGNTGSMYAGIKEATGPSSTKSAPLKTKAGEPIDDQRQQMERWVEHYLELYATQNVVTDAALNAIPDLSVLDELDAEPTMVELSKAIDRLSTGKAPGEDGIPPEVIKSGKDALLQDLHELLCLCWREGAVPQDMRDAKIVTLYKNKGDRSDCNSYRGISLLSIVGKVFARVALARVQVLAERVYPESQCGFRAGRSTVDMVFSVRQLQEKCREQNKPLYLAFIDLSKAFDLVSRSGLFKVLRKVGCPPRLLAVVESFHKDMQSTVCYNGAMSDPFPVVSGVKQGCVLAPTLFGIFFSKLLSYAFRDNDDGVYLHTRSDGRLFNLARLRSKTKVRAVTIREALFADDAALATHTEQALQRLVDCLAHACDEFGLTISLKKTEVMAQGTDSPPSIHIGDYPLNLVSQFKYLGSTISSNLSLEPEISARIAKAAGVMSKLQKRVWSNNNLTDNTKVQVYRACVLSTLLYSSEAWTTYAAQERRLNSFHLRCLRRILGIRWQDRIPNTEVLERARLPSIFALLTQRRLRWLGHVRRMDDGRIPKDLLYGELAGGARPRGRPALRFKDTCKRDLRSAGINTETWESLAGDRGAWRAAAHGGVVLAETERTERAEQRRAKRQASSTALAATPHVCPSCSRDCHSRIGLHSHSRKCNPRPSSS